MSFSTPRANKRRFFRVPLRVQVQRADSSRTDYALNISPGGMCIQTTEACDSAARIRLRFRIGTEGKDVETEAEVMWCFSDEERSPGLRYYEMGLRFRGLPEREAEEIDRFIEESLDPDSVDSGFDPGS